MLFPSAQQAALHAPLELKVRKLKAEVLEGGVWRGCFLEEHYAKLRIHCDLPLRAIGSRVKKSTGLKLPCRAAFDKTVCERVGARRPSESGDFFVCWSRRWTGRHAANEARDIFGKLAKDAERRAGEELNGLPDRG